MTPLQAAIAYTRRGWSVVPVPFRSKSPGFKGWQQLRLKEVELPDRFGDGPRNIGVLMGEPSGWLVDVDLDHLRCVELADQFLPPTPAAFGRVGKPRSHRLYRVTGPVATKQHKSKSAGTLVELRSTGGHTVFPPSVHREGEAITWETEDAEPAVVDPELLHEAVQTLADAVRVKLGEKPVKKPAAKPKKRQAPPAPGGTAPAATPTTFTATERCAACLKAMLRIGTRDGNDGSSRLYTAACRVVDHDLDDADALRTIREYARKRPFPSSWTDDQILKRVRDAEQRVTRGAAFQLDDDGCVPLGARDVKSGKLVLSPRKTLPSVIAFIEEFYSNSGARSLVDYAGTLLTWHSNRYVQIEDGFLRQELQTWLHDALRYTLNKASGELELIPFESNPSTVNAVLESVRSFTHLPATITPPSWLTDAGHVVSDQAALSLPDPGNLLAFPSGTLDLSTEKVIPPTPVLFNINAIDFEYDPNPDPPERWIKLLEQIWENDLESVYLLQEWMGYCLVADTSQQKMLLMVGPKRSGKGTIGRVISRLVGAANVAGPTTSSLAGAFGLQPLIGKSLAIVSDARFSGDNIGIVVERLLCISGEDTLSVDRKFLGSVTMKLPTRFMFLTNELPRMNDASGALAGRFAILRLTHSFYGKEDVTLTQQLMAELPGILLWAIDGLKRLRQRGYFVQPKSVADAVQDLEDLASPVGAFVRDRCRIGNGERAWVDDLYAAWKVWCENDGRIVITNKQLFGRDLSAAVPGVVCRRHSMQGRFYDGISVI